MAHQIIWSEDAIEDINNIAEYISRDSLNYAKAVAEKLFLAPSIIENNPKAGRIVPEFTDENIRELFIYSYRLIYRIENNLIQVGAVIHGARDLEKIIVHRNINV